MSTSYWPALGSLLHTLQDSSVVKDARELVEAKYGPQTDDFVKVS